MFSLLFSRVWKYIAMAVALIAAVFYFKRQGKQEEQERQLKLNLEDYSNTRKRIDEVVRSTPDDYDAASEWLRKRNEQRRK